METPGFYVEWEEIPQRSIQKRIEELPRRCALLVQREVRKLERRYGDDMQKTAWKTSPSRGFTSCTDPQMVAPAWFNAPTFCSATICINNPQTSVTTRKHPRHKLPWFKSICEWTFHTYHVWERRAEINLLYSPPTPQTSTRPNPTVANMSDTCSNSRLRDWLFAYDPIPTSDAHSKAAIRDPRHVMHSSK